MQALFQPLALPTSFDAEALGNHLSIYQTTFPDWQAAEMVMFGLDESADAIRQHFYPLSFHFEGLQLADLGNLQA
ncbi:MAG: hypothetical protein ACKVTZ_17695, partial [Bacteroidia bacterium]